MKKILLVFLSLGLATAMLAGCGSDGSSSTTSMASDSSTISSDVASSDLSQSSDLESNMESASSELSSASQSSAVSSSVSSSVSSTVSSKPASSATPSKPASSTPSSGSSSSKPASSTVVSSKPPVASVTPQQICKSIAAAYGSNYLPDGEMPTEHIYGLFSVDSSLVESVYGETSMISVNPDMAIVMKAASGKASQLESEMKKARDQYVETARLYPKDTAKLHASTVVRSGDYVAFLMLGAIDETNEDVDSAAAQKFAQDQVQIGVKAFQNAAKG